MKDFLRIICVSVLMFATSCEDTLDLTPIDTGSVDGFFTSTTDVIAGVNGVYNSFTGSWWGGAFIHVQPHFEAVTENAVICCAWEYQYKAIAQGTFSPNTGGVVTWKWDYGYRAIFRINSILEVIESGVIEDLDSSSDTYKQIVGELRFLRAYVYHELTFLYGDVPLVLKTLTPAEARVITRTARSQVEDAMYADMDYAIANLQETPFQGEFGRPTKQAALSLKGRAQLFRNDFANAASTLAQVIAMEGGAVDLDPNYESLFRGSNEQSPEIIFSLQYVDSEVGAGEGNFLGAHYGPNQLAGTTASQGQGWGAFQFTQHLIDDYYMTDGLPFDQSPLYDPDNPFANRDSRFSGTFFFPGETYRGTVLIENNFNSNGAVKDIPIASRKWKNETSNNSFSSNGGEDFILIRYADILLMWAEATNEISGPTAAVYEAVNKVRARVGMPNFDVGSHTMESMRDEIKHERKVEFFMEGTRYYDLLRWRDAETVLLMPNINEARTFDPGKHYLWPIPQFAIDQSPSITQNPGY
ncbi:MAG: RagB/SusD family nutrient uptake outer membrane protein [Bacteroidia bacterium]|nr:RagB/SusD family nutrient uptake outer membrane protein [Bacteroidia bacterium]